MSDRRKYAARYHLALLLIAASLVMTACGTSTDDSTDVSTTTPAITSTTASSTTVPSTTTTVADTTTTTVPPAVDAGLELPRAATYASVIFEIVAGEYSNDTPGTYLEDEPDIGDMRYLYLSFVADFEPGYPATSEDFDVDLFSLTLSDGTSVPVQKVDFRSTILLSDEPYASALAFPGDDLDLAGSVLTYDNAVNEPMVLPLDGAVPEDLYPIVVDMDASADVEYQGGCANASGYVNVLEAEWDVDAGVDQNLEEIVRAGTTRTLVGERFVRIRVQAIAESGSCGGTVLTADAFRLVVDGLPLGPENNVSELLKDGEGVEVVWGFRVPVDADQITLDVGVSDGLVASIPIDMPDNMP